MKLKGRLKSVFLGGPAWVLEAEDGVTWQIVGDVAADLEGGLVFVEGNPSEKQFGVNMIGAIFEAESIRRQ